MMFRRLFRLKFFSRRRRFAPKVGDKFDFVRCVRIGFGGAAKYMS